MGDTTSGADYSAITSAVTTGLSDVSSQAIAMIAAVLPAALVVLGAIVVISIGIRVFKRVSGANRTG